MQLNNLKQLNEVATKVNFSIFELPIGTDFAQIFTNSPHITVPKDKTTIPIESIREITGITANKQSGQLFIIIENAEKLSINAANAFLKALEEPGEHIHYIFLTNDSSSILPTMKSRANNYYLQDQTKVSDPPKADTEIFKLAKEYVAASQTQLPQVVDKILKYDKNATRETALAVVRTASELMYKSYLMRGNDNFLIKLEKLIKAEEAITQNGHVKLQLIANML